MNFKQFLFPSDTKRKVWLDFLDYANRLFAAGREDLWSNPDTFISVYSQGQGLLHSDVLSLSILDFYADLINRELDVKEPWTGRRPTFALKKLLALEEPRNVLLDVLSGLQNLYRGNPPIVLAIPSPQRLLLWLDSVVQLDQDHPISHDDIEAAAMYLAEYLRSFSTSGLSAIVIMESDSPLLDLNEALSLYQPVFNIVKHYQWSVGIQQGGTAHEITRGGDEVDFYLYGDSEISALLPLWKKGPAIGGGLNRNFWEGNSNLPELPSIGLTYGMIPGNAEPEKVLAQLKKLRS
jgi:hypothetical protein